MVPHGLPGVASGKPIGVGGGELPVIEEGLVAGHAAVEEGASWSRVHHSGPKRRQLASGGAYRDDSQVKHLEVHMREPVEGGRAVVQIEEMEDPPPRVRSVLTGTPLCPGNPFGRRAA